MDVLIRLKLSLPTGFPGIIVTVGNMGPEKFGDLS